MKTEKEILDKIQKLEQDNENLQVKKDTIVDQNEINVDDMNKLMSKENQVKDNLVHIDILKWVLE